MEYLFEMGTPITEEDALAELAELGLHSLAFDLDLHEDEPLHWHEFDSVSYVISGSGSFANEHGNVTEVGPGCRWRLRPAGCTATWPVLRTEWSSGPTSPGERWTAPINKDPADRPPSLAI